jgi:hypothetical protein
MVCRSGSQYYLACLPGTCVHRGVEMDYYKSQHPVESNNHKSLGLKRNKYFRRYSKVEAGAAAVELQRMYKLAYILALHHTVLHPYVQSHHRTWHFGSYWCMRQGY